MKETRRERCVWWEIKQSVFAVYGQRQNFHPNRMGKRNGGNEADLKNPAVLARVKHVLQWLFLKGLVQSEGVGAVTITGIDRLVNMDAGMIKNPSVGTAATLMCFMSGSITPTRKIGTRLRLTQSGFVLLFFAIYELIKLQNQCSNGWKDILLHLLICGQLNTFL